MNELDETAVEMADAAPFFTSINDARRYVRAQMPGESEAIVDGVVDGLLRHQRRAQMPQ